MKYDIFISYRREGGAQYARILQLMLQQRGYKVFLDYDELVDGIFREHIKQAIKEAGVFLLILSKGSIARCVNEDDWFRQEMLLAAQENKQIIPINPDGMFDGPPKNEDSANIPPEIMYIVREYQYSEVRFGQGLGDTIDLMIKKRIAPILGEKSQISSIHPQDALELFSPDEKRSEIRWFVWAKRVLAGVIVAIVLGLCCCYIVRLNTQSNIENAKNFRSEMHEKYRNLDLYLSPNVSTLQMVVIDEILQNMSEVRKGELWMSQFEFTKGQWYGLQGIHYNEVDRKEPITGVTYGEIYQIIGKLCDMTNLEIALPTVEEWEYAANGGKYNENTLYVGNAIAEKVAWYRENSGGKAHPSDGQQGKEPNMLDLYDMSGNVGELCNTLYSGIPSVFTVCGGDYNSTLDEIKKTAREALHVEAKEETVGFRIIIRKRDLKI